MVPVIVTFSGLALIVPSQKRVQIAALATDPATMELASAISDGESPTVVV